MLAAAGGATNAEIAARLHVHLETVARWRARFVVNGLEGISREAPRAGASGRVPRSTVRRIVHASLAARSPAGTAWSTRSLARSLRVNHMLVHRVWATHGLGPRLADGAAAVGRPRVDLGGAYVTPAARAVVFTVDEHPPPAATARAVPELVPNPTSTAEFSGPEGLSREVVRAVGAIEAAPARRGPRSDASLLVFLRGVEQNARRSDRLEVVFDRPLGRLGQRVARWLAAHARFRVFTPARAQRWSGAVDAWLHRWERSGLDRESLGLVPEFARQFPILADTGPGAAPPLRFSWGPGGIRAPLGPSPTPGLSPPASSRRAEPDRGGPTPPRPSDPAAGSPREAPGRS